jgi:hypothetical protein
LRLLVALIFVSVMLSCLEDLHLAALRDNYWHLGLVVATNWDGLLKKHKRQAECG